MSTNLAWATCSPHALTCKPKVKQASTCKEAGPGYCRHQQLTSHHGATHQAAYAQKVCKQVSKSPPRNPPKPLGGSCYSTSSCCTARVMSRWEVLLQGNQLATGYTDRLCPIEYKDRVAYKPHISRLRASECWPAAPEPQPAASAS